MRTATSPVPLDTTHRADPLDVGITAGIDLSDRWSDVAIKDPAGDVLAEARVTNDPEGIRHITDLLKQVAPRRWKRVPVALERPRSLFVDALVAAGVRIVPIDPTLAARHRGLRSPSGKKKSDAADARLLADMLRVDGLTRRPAPANSATVQRLAVLMRGHLAATRMRTDLLHRIRALLVEYHPAMVAAYPEHQLRSAQARAVLAAAPTPGLARELTRAQLADILVDAGRARRIADEAERLQLLMRADRLRQPPAIEGAMGIRLLSLLRLLDALCDEIDDALHRMTEVLHTHPDAPTYLAVPGLGPVLATRLLAEIGDDRARFATARGFCSYAGLPPITWSSGTSTRVYHRTAANKNLKATFFQAAFCSLSHSPHARALYNYRRMRGDRYAAALRQVSLRHARALHHCLHAGVAYDDARAFRRLTAVTPDPDGVRVPTA
ncbi:IS110 family transposase (plasmid) [Embleya sp. NBC_00888]|uniref:IS110 family transposase n=1 Tax=Embleya sp. NBC_00888 TaxID=2975960 RepID=UPI003870425A|nr:IS110 family transposase [Embleya sp. NBC_00888]